MTTSLAHQTLTLTRHKIALTPSREKFLPLGHKKTIKSRRPALYFIRGIETPPNAPFFPPIPPSFPLRFGVLIAKLSTHLNTLPPLTGSRLIAREAGWPKIFIRVVGGVTELRHLGGSSEAGFSSISPSRITFENHYGEGNQTCRMGGLKGRMSHRLLTRTVPQRRPTPP